MHAKQVLSIDQEFYSAYNAPAHRESGQCLKQCGKCWRPHNRFCDPTFQAPSISRRDCTRSINGLMLSSLKMARDSRRHSCVNGLPPGGPPLWPAARNSGPIPADESPPRRLPVHPSPSAGRLLRTRLSAGGTGSWVGSVPIYVLVRRQIAYWSPYVSLSLSPVG